MMNENSGFFQAGFFIGQIRPSQTIFMHWLKAVDDGEIGRIAFVKKKKKKKGLQEMTMKADVGLSSLHLRWPITGFLWKIMTAPSSKMSTF